VKHRKGTKVEFLGIRLRYVPEEKTRVGGGEGKDPTFGEGAYIAGKRCQIFEVKGKGFASSGKSNSRDIKQKDNLWKEKNVRGGGTPTLI